MKLWNLFLAAVLGLALAACSTPGRPYDDSRIANITRGQTTETELLNWFGPPSTRNLAPDGSKTLAWRFSKSSTGRSVPSGKLDVRLGPDGKVTAYTASGS